MNLLRAVTDCHRRLLDAAETLRHELDAGKVTQALIRLRLEMAISARENLSATQRLWSQIEREIPDIRTRVRGYDGLKCAENDLHVKYASHIAAWSLTAIDADFSGFANAKRQFIADLRRHTRQLDVKLFQPACQALEDHSHRPAKAEKIRYLTTSYLPPILK